MYHSDLYIAEVTMHSRLQERRGQQDNNRLLTELKGRKRYVLPALGWLGTRLVAWGSLLQERYSTATTTPQPANRLLN